MKSLIFNKVKYLLLICINVVNSQDLVVTPPNPSVSNLMELTLNEVNLVKGKPNISIPIINTSTSNKDLNVNINLSYDTSSISYHTKASDVGSGWSLVGEPVISRKIFFLPDEKEFEYLNFYNQLMGTNISPYASYDDIYDYSFFGYSGSFGLRYDEYENLYVEKHDINNLKIEFELESDLKRVSKFIITDENGLEYIFDVKNLDKRRLHEFGHHRPNHIPQTGEFILDQEYMYSDFYFTNTYHLSKVNDIINNPILTVEYESFLKSYYFEIPENTTITNKLKKINVIGKSEINFQYHLNTSLELSSSDPIELDYITLKNLNQEQIKKFEFNYSTYSVNLNNLQNFDRNRKRSLDKLSVYGSDSLYVEETFFDYNLDLPSFEPLSCSNFNKGWFSLDKSGYLSYPPLHEEDIILNYPYDIYSTNKIMCVFGSLKKIKYPTGGITEYDFESNTYKLRTAIYGPTTMDDYKRYNYENNVYTTILDEPFSTSYSKTLIISGNEPQKIYVKLFSNPYYPPFNEPGEPSYATGKITGNNNEFNFDVYEISPCGYEFVLEPGNYNIQFNAINEVVTGQVVITKREFSSNIEKWIYGGGLRIKSITIQDVVDTSNPIPTYETKRKIDYYYNNFDDIYESSGDYYEGNFRAYEGANSISPTINYANVLVKESGKGFTKHFFKSFYDSSYNNTSEKPFFTLYKDGIQEKEQVYNEDNYLIKETLLDYQLYQNDNIDLTFYTFSNGGNNNFITHPSTLRLTMNNSTNHYYNNGTQSSINQIENFFYDNFNNKVKIQTSTGSAGEVKKTIYSYAHEVNNTVNDLMVIKNLVGIPLITKSIKNQELLSTQEIVYKDWGNGYLSPELIKASKGTLGLEIKAKYNHLDPINGNALEVQQESGKLISYIWGYNKTQPVAKLENIAYNSIPSNHIQAIETASNANNEANLISALNALRNDPALSNTMITTYTYKPLVGVSSITDPKGNTITYHYDSFGRLEFVKDKDGNILSENEYHYRTQN